MHLKRLYNGAVSMATDTASSCYCTEGPVPVGSGVLSTQDGCPVCNVCVTITIPRP